MTTTKTHWKKVFNKDYLGSHDLDEKDLKAIIHHVEVRAVKDSSGKEGKCNVAVFEGNIKPMILNVTNCKIIKRFSGTNYIEQWSNIPVTIYSKQIKAFGEETEGLRIREKQPVMKKESLTPDHPRWGEAIKYLGQPDSVIDNILKQYEVTEDNLSKLQEAAL